MNQIKSKRAQVYIESLVVAKFDEDATLISIGKAKKAIQISEQEAEERHAKELQELHDMYKHIFIEHESAINSDKYHAEENHKIELDLLRDKAVESHRKCCTFYTGFDGGHCNRGKKSGQDGNACNWMHNDCSYMRVFTQEINEKQ